MKKIQMFLIISCFILGLGAVSTVMASSIVVQNLETGAGDPPISFFIEGVPYAQGVRPHDQPYDIGDHAELRNKYLHILIRDDQTQNLITCNQQPYYFDNDGRRLWITASVYQGVTVYCNAYWGN